MPKTPNRAPAFVLAALAAVVLCGPAHGASPGTEVRVATGLRAYLDAGRPEARVVVRRAADSRPGPVLAAIAGSPGTRTFPRLGMLAATVTAGEIERLVAEPGVAGISLDHDLHALGRVTAESRMPRAAARGAARRGRGGAAVALLDSGVGPGRAPGASVSAGFVPGENAHDAHGHGSILASLIANAAPGTRLVSLKVLDARGRGRVSSALAAMEWLLENGERHDVRVATLAFAREGAGTCVDDPLCLGTKALRDAGILVVAAAAPARERGLASPASAVSVLAVGAADDRGTPRRGDDRVADGSPRGLPPRTARPKPDLVAWDTSGAHRGTSIAAARVAAIAARIASEVPGISVDGLTGALLYTCQTLSGADALDQGAGLVNAEGALRLARRLGKLPTAAGARRGGIELPEPFSEIDGELVPWSAGNLVVPGVLVTTRFRPAESALLGDVRPEGTLVLAGGALEVGELRIGREIVRRPRVKRAGRIRFTAPGGRPIDIARASANEAGERGERERAGTDRKRSRTPSARVAASDERAPYSARTRIDAPSARTDAR